MLKTLGRLVVLGVIVVAAYSSGLLSRGWEASSQWVADEWPVVAEQISAAAASVTPSPSAAPGTPGDATSFAFLKTEADGSPVSWDACTPIRVVINPANAPEGGVEDAVAALDVLSKTSGLTFRYDGLVDNALHKGWGEQAERGFAGWAPVLFGWASPDTGLLESNVGGRATTVRAVQGGHVSYVSGMVVINSTLDAGRTGGFDQVASRGAVYLHELAHIAGLGHVEDQGQLMHPATAFGDRYGAGDVAGLQMLGSQPCTPAPAAKW